MCTWGAMGHFRKEVKKCSFWLGLEDSGSVEEVCSVAFSRGRAGWVRSELSYAQLAVSQQCLAVGKRS